MHRVSVCVCWAFGWRGVWVRDVDRGRDGGDLWPGRIGYQPPQLMPSGSRSSLLVSQGKAASRESKMSGRVWASRVGTDMGVGVGEGGHA